MLLCRVTNGATQAIVNLKCLDISPGAIDKFNEHFNWTAKIDRTYANANRPNPNTQCVNDGPEPDLDAQYISALGQDAYTWSWDSGSQFGTWLLTWSQEVLQMDASIRPQVSKLVDACLSLHDLSNDFDFRCSQYHMGTLRHGNVTKHPLNALQIRTLQTTSVELSQDSSSSLSSAPASSWQAVTTASCPTLTHLATVPSTPHVNALGLDPTRGIPMLPPA